jgi:transcriptional regulator with GAF, ATPase, and Fis domain
LVTSRPAPTGDAAPYLFLLLDCDRPFESCFRFRLAEYDRVVIGRDTSRGVVRLSEQEKRVLVVRQADRWMSSVHARIERGSMGWVLEDAGSKNGVFVNGVRTERVELVDGDLIDLGHTVFLFRADLPISPEESPHFDAALSPAPAIGLATLSPGLARHFAPLPEFSRSALPLLVLGESGTGKELIARAVHALSGRSGDFVAVNCGALPDTLVETELFGYRKGAFSGANEDRPGLVRAADRGTLFLDEIGDLAPASQAVLLRVLQEREVLPVGGTRALPVDIRVVSATHRNLQQLVDSGAFRGDLLARLSGHTLALPPLRHRREDLGLLVQTLLRRLAPERVQNLALSIEAVRALMLHEWPFNIRELEKALERALVLARSGRIELAHLPEGLQAKRDIVRRTVATQLSDEDRKLRDELIEHLKKHKGNVSAVAREMGKARMQIQRWIRRFGIDVEGMR